MLANAARHWNTIFSFPDHWAEKSWPSCSRKLRSTVTISSRATTTTAIQAAISDPRLVRQEDKRAADNHLVGQWIENAAQLRDLIPAASQPTVQPIGPGRDGEQNDRPRIGVAMQGRRKRPPIAKHASGKSGWEDSRSCRMRLLVKRRCCLAKDQSSIDLFESQLFGINRWPPRYCASSGLRSIWTPFNRN